MLEKVLAGERKRRAVFTSLAVYEQQCCPEGGAEGLSQVDRDFNGRYFPGGIYLDFKLSCSEFHIFISRNLLQGKVLLFQSQSEIFLAHHITGGPSIVSGKKPPKSWDQEGSHQRPT